jgi:general secretion pathway protein G
MVRGISKSGRINSQLVRAAEIRRRLGAIGNQRALQGARGFTLLELMIVISIIMILMAVAVPVYNQSIIQARESVLRSNLSTLRNVISQYTLDKQKAPQSLDDLVQGG